MKIPTPSWQQGPTIITDTKGRKIELRNLTLLEATQLLQCLPAGTNEAFVAMVSLVGQVRKIDAKSIKVPTTPRQINRLLETLGNEGLLAITELLSRQVAEYTAIAETLVPATPKPFQWIELGTANA